ncbi:hypothetical protein [Alcaligenes faecalis]|uniref:hypothetical protein n=1 Tax=Alcaligenes aquatilis TaxID=323284 RepID=UPI002AA92456|nr:hypothetical protein [Alcaligenes faecalis]
MNRRYFLSALGAISLTLLAGCQDDLTAPFVGYWLEQKEDGPAIMHVKEDGPDLLIRIRTSGYMLFLPAKVKQAKTMTIDNKKQLIYDKPTGTLIDPDKGFNPFKKISQIEFENLIAD